VLAGQAPPGIDLGLPTRVLPLFETWPWPGNSLEGYKSADEFLGPRGAAAQFAADYRSGYTCFASVGSVPEVMVHTPPYIQVEVAEFALGHPLEANLHPYRGAKIVSGTPRHEVVDTSGQHRGPQHGPRTPDDR